MPPLTVFRGGFWRGVFTFVRTASLEAASFELAGFCAAATAFVLPASTHAVPAVFSTLFPFLPATAVAGVALAVVPSRDVVASLAGAVRLACCAAAICAAGFAALSVTDSTL